MEYTKKTSSTMWEENGYGLYRKIGTISYMISKGMTKYNLYIYIPDSKSYRLLKNNISLKYAKECALKHYDRYLETM
jgi:hypothetical protein